MNAVVMCSAYDIRQLNETKKYTLIATDLINNLLVNANLSAGAVKLWQYLYSKATFNNDLKFSISYQGLSDIFQKSLRTIQRYVVNLKENGYVFIEENFNSSGQQANTFYLRFPQSEIASFRTSKDRKPSPTQPETKVMDSDRPHCTIVEKNEPVLKTAVSNESSSGTEYMNPKTKNVIPRGDISDIHNTNILTINKNNNPVVVLSFDETITNLAESSLELEKQRFEKLTHQRDDAYQVWLEARQKKELPDVINKTWHYFGELDTAVHLAKLKLEDLQKTVARQTQKAAEITTYQINPRFMLERAGDRVLSEFTYKRLVRELDSLGFQRQQKNQLINEIVFEIRFGSLTKSNKTGEELSLDNAMNISLKLVKEQRWGTPVLLKQAVATRFSKAG